MGKAVLMQSKETMLMKVLENCVPAMKRKKKKRMMRMKRRKKKNVKTYVMKMMTKMAKR